MEAIQHPSYENSSSESLASMKPCLSQYAGIHEVGDGAGTKYVLRRVELGLCVPLSNLCVADRCVSRGFSIKS